MKQETCDAKSEGDPRKDGIDRDEGCLRNDAGSVEEGGAGT